jgi:hypothetical protein
VKVTRATTKADIQHPNEGDIKKLPAIISRQSEDLRRDERESRLAAIERIADSAFIILNVSGRLGIVRSLTVAFGNFFRSGAGYTARTASSILFAKAA